MRDVVCKLGIFHCFGHPRATYGVGSVEIVLDLWKQRFTILGSATGDEWLRTRASDSVASLFLVKITDGLTHGEPGTINVTLDQF